MCRQRAANRAAIGRPRSAAAAVAAFARRHRCGQAAGDVGSACRGVGGVRGARRAAPDVRGVVARSLSGALCWCPFWGAHVGAAIGREFAPFGFRGSSEAAPVGAGLAWGWWQVALGPARAVRAPVRPRFGRSRASDRMHAHSITVSRIIEIQSPVCVTALVPGCCYVLYDPVP